MKKIVVTGMGYVGLSNAILLAQNNEVIAIDIDEEKINMVNNGISPLKDKEIEEYLASKNLHLKASSDYKSAYEQADYIFISTPTNYDECEKFFDTSSVESVISDINKINNKAVVIIKSTVPIGFSEKIAKVYPDLTILFSPEFLREGKALYDNLYPSRIIVGANLKDADNYDISEKTANLLAAGAKIDDVPKLIMNYAEAESIKLFSNTYLALRVCFFNELDTFAELNDLDTKKIIEGVSLDPRIGNYYNNPSFGYGGYCLPKDSKQLLANYEDIPQNLMEAIVESNYTRKDHIANEIIKTAKSLNKDNVQIGVYKLAMKSDSDNSRYSAIFGVIEALENNGLSIAVYDPTINDDNSSDYKVYDSLEEFKKDSDIILTNRLDDNNLEDIKEKIYTRDIYFRD